MELEKKIYNNLSIECLENETWIDVIGFDGIYEVSNYGRIKSLGRYVNVRNGQRWLKKRIRKQSLSYDGRLTCPLQGHSINVSSIVFLSFNTEIDYDPKKQCVMHINKIKSDNRLSNLKIETISKSHKVNYQKKLLPHLKINNDNRRNKYLKLTHKICSKCNEKKTIINFEYGRNKCKCCRKKYKRKKYEEKRMDVYANTKRKSL